MSLTRTEEWVRREYGHEMATAIAAALEQALIAVAPAGVLSALRKIAAEPETPDIEGS